MLFGPFFDVTNPMKVSGAALRETLDPRTHPRVKSQVESNSGNALHNQRTRTDCIGRTDAGMSAGSAVVAHHDERTPARPKNQLAGDWEMSCPRRRRRVLRDLEGEQSPWKERVIRRWKRRRVTTDSSVEKSLGIEASSGAEADHVTRQRAAWKATTPLERMRGRATRVRLEMLDDRDSIGILDTHFGVWPERAERRSTPLGAHRDAAATQTGLPACEVPEK
jgi:hypothetical protein